MSSADEPTKESADDPQPRSRSRSLWAIAVLAVASAAIYFATNPGRNAGPQPPDIDYSSATPREQESIKGAIDEVKSSPNDANTWGRLALLLRHKYQDEELTCLEHAQRLDPANVLWHYLRGVDLVGRDNVEALVHLKKAVELDDKYIATRVKYANLLILEEELDEAEKQLKIALDSDPDHPWAQHEMARVKVRRGAYEEAIDWALRSAKTDPDQFSNHEVLAQAYHRLGKQKEAQRHSDLMKPLIEKEITWGEPLADEAFDILKEKGWHHQEAELLIGLGQIDDAMLKYVEDLENLPEDTLGAINYTILLVQRRDLKRAAAVLDRALAEQPNSADLHFHRGVVYFYERDLERAALHFRKAIATKPTYAQAHSNLGHALRAMNDIDGAIEAFRTAVRNKSDLWESHLNLGAMLLDQGKIATAKEHLSAALDLMPHDHQNRAVAEQLLSKAMSQ